MTCGAQEARYINFRAQTGRYRSGQTGRTVNPLAYAFSGSNPLLPSCDRPSLTTLLVATL